MNDDCETENTRRVHGEISLLHHYISTIMNIRLTLFYGSLCPFTDRIKKKARFDDLIEIEKKYMLVKEIELLHVRRRLRLIDFVEQRAEKRCINSSRLYELASQEILNPEFSVTDAVVLTSDNSCTVRVLAHGSSLDLANPKTLSGMICVDFAPGSTDIRDISLYWSTTSSVSTSFPPSVSLSNLEW